MKGGEGRRRGEEGGGGGGGGRRANSIPVCPDKISSFPPPLRLLPQSELIRERMDGWFEREESKVALHNSKQKHRWREILGGVGRSSHQVRNSRSCSVLTCTAHTTLCLSSLWLRNGQFLPLFFFRGGGGGGGETKKEAIF